MQIYQSSAISPTLELRTLLKIHLPSCLSNLYEYSIPHGQLEGNDVADTSYGDETWTTEFVGLVAERGEGHGRCMRFGVDLHAYRHLRWDGDDT